jgi:AcrR family transcriptional regulator
MAFLQGGGAAFHIGVTVCNVSERSSAKAEKQPSPRVLKRRAEILEAAKRAVEKVGSSVSMDDIATEARIARPILYRYFKDRSGLTQALAIDFANNLLRELEPYLRDLKAITMESLPSLAHEVIDRFLSVVEKNPRLYSFLINRAVFEDEKTRQPLETFLEVVGRSLSVALGELIAAGGGDSGAAEPTAYALIGMIAFAAEWWARRAVVSKRRMVEYVASLAVNGLAGLANLSSTTPPLPAASKKWN